MKEHPILFTGPMVRAILDGRKTQTRRLVKPQPDQFGLNEKINVDPLTGWLIPGHSGRWDDDQATDRIWKCPYGIAGDRIWVKETFYIDDCRWIGKRLPEEKPDDWDDRNVYYRADGECCEQIPECCCAEVGKPKWRNARFMNRWLARITLEVLSVRVERVQDISEDDAIAEGVLVKSDSGIASQLCQGHPTPAQFEFYALWNSINTKRGFGWNINPWVWRIEFKMV